MELRAGYKKTEVGVIPQEWDCVQLGDIGESIIGLTYKPSDVRNNGKLVLRSCNVYENTLAYKNNVYVDLKVNEKLIIQEDDILICVRNGSRNLIGKCAIIDKGIEGQTFGAFMSIFRSNYGKYLFNCFQSDIIKKQINDNMGATINQITNKTLNAFKIPLPKDEIEQQVISTALFDTEGIITSIAKLIDKKKNIKKGAMQELLTGKRRLNGFSGECVKKTEVGIIPQEWDCIKVEECVSIKTGSRNTENKQNNGMYPFYVRSQQVENINSFAFDCEAVLTAGDGVGTGKVFHYINGKFDVHQRVYVMSDFKNILGKYFYNYFSSFFYDEVCKYTAKSSVDSVRRDMIAKMLLRIPPIPEQQAIATVLSDMDSEIETLEQKLIKFKNIKKGMMHELLTGNIRLV